MLIERDRLGELEGKMRILVTGGCGFVGRHLIGALLERGDEVVCVDPIVPLTGGLLPDNWPFFNPGDYKGFTFIQKDCREFFAEDSSYFDIAHHLAAMVGGRLMIDHEPLAVAEDLAIDAMFWRWTQKVRPGKCVYYSSSAAYPVQLQKSEGYRLLTEGDIVFGGDIGMPDMTYGWAKLTGEYLGQLAFAKFGIKCCSYRPFSGYGEDQDLTYPFPAIAKRVIDYVGPGDFVVWGSGRQMRDFVHIDDCVSCILKTEPQVEDGSAINISSSIYTSFIDLATMMLNLEGKAAKVIGMSDRPEGVFARGGAREFQDKLGFAPVIPLIDGAKRMLDFQRGRAVA